MRRAGLQRVGLRRLASIDTGGGGSITLIQGSSPIHVVNGSGPTVTVTHEASGVVPGAYTLLAATIDADGHVTAAANGTIGANSITNAMLALAPAQTLKGNDTAGIANVADLTVAQVVALLGLGTAAFQPSGAFDAAGAAAAAQAASQPLNSNLTAIAALATTAYGRALLTLADQAALQAAVGGVVKVSDLSANGTSVSSASWAANAYRKVEFELQWQAAVQLSGFTLVGLSAGTYGETLYYTASGGTTIGTVNNAAVNNWMFGGSSNGPGVIGGMISLPPAPARKAFRGTEFDGSYSRMINSWSTDATHNPTQLTFSFGGATDYTLRVWGYP